MSRRNEKNINLLSARRKRDVKLKFYMKKIIITSTVLLIALIAVLFFACKKDYKEQQADTSKQDFIKLMHEGAIVHNECMAYIYEKLAEDKPETDVLSVVENLSLEFIKSHPFFKSNIDGASKNAKDIFKICRNTKSTRANLWLDEDDHLLSESQKEWLTLIDNVIKNNDNVDKMCIELDKIEQLVLKNGNDKDQDIVIIAVEIGKESLRYWYLHHTEWEQLTPEDFSKRWFNWNDVAGDDLACGIGGAIVGVVVDGVGAAAGFVGGAIAGSAANAVSQVWHHWF